MTENQLERLKSEWESFAKEPLTIEEIKGTIYAYGSELACLRLFYSYRHTFALNGKANSDYSFNKKTYYFRLETQ